MMRKRPIEEYAEGLFDASIAAQKVMSVILRARDPKSVNASTIVRTLLGKEGGFNNIKTFGAGTDVPECIWWAIAEEMKIQGILERASDEDASIIRSSYLLQNEKSNWRPALRLNEKSNWRPVLRGDEKFHLTAEPLRAYEARRAEETLFNTISEPKTDLKGRKKGRSWYTTLEESDIAEAEHLQKIILGEVSFFQNLLRPRPRRDQELLKRLQRSYLDNKLGQRAISEIIARKPVSVDELASIPDSILPTFLREQHGGNIVEIVTNVLAMNFDNDFLACMDETVYHLKEWRGREAEKTHIPELVILHNHVLESIAREQPKTLDDLQNMEGIGKTRASRFGEAILQIIASSTD
jgi:superfamily II DNA helicase RecQ